MRIAIFGAGGVGGYFGARLAQAGQEVIFIARGDHLSAIRTCGLRINSFLGNFTLNPVCATSDPKEIGLVDFLIVSVKSWQIRDAIPEIRLLVGSHTLVLPLCNGIDHINTLVDNLGVSHVLGGLCRISSYIEAPGIIHHVAGVTPYVALGTLDNQPDERCLELLNAFSVAGVKAEIPPDIQAAMWEKFIFICGISGMGSLTRVPVGILRTIPETRQLLLRDLDEIHQVSKAMQINLPGDIVNRTIGFIDKISPDVIPSMQRDIIAQKPSELEHQPGTVVKYGKRTGIPTPINEVIYYALLPQERLARKVI